MRGIGQGLVFWAYPLRFCKVDSLASANLTSRIYRSNMQRHQDDNPGASKRIRGKACLIENMEGEKRVGAVFKIAPKGMGSLFFSSANNRKIQ